MKQCKLCETLLEKEPTTGELDKHWKKHHNWHWESNKEKTPEEALLKKKSKRRLGVVIVYSMPKPLNEAVKIMLASRYKRNCYHFSYICLIEM